MPLSLNTKLFKKMSRTPSSLNDDELDLVFQFINVLDVKVLNTLTLVNKRFFSLASSDRYWTEFDNKLNLQHSNPKPKRTQIVKHKRMNEHVGDICRVKTFYNGFALLLFGFLLNIAAFGMAILWYLIEDVWKAADCHQYSISNSTEIIYNTIPFPNTTCIPCEKGLAMCDFKNSFYPCCIETSKCTYDKIPTDSFKLTIEVRTEITMHSDGYKFIRPTQYKCGGEDGPLTH